MRTHIKDYKRKYFLRNFNTIYYCRIFPEEWAQYNIAGKWAGQSSGGAPQKDEVWYPKPKVERFKGGINQKRPIDKKASKFASLNSNSNMKSNMGQNIKKKPSVLGATSSLGNSMMRKKSSVQNSMSGTMSGQGQPSNMGNKSMASVKSIESSQYSQAANNVIKEKVEKPQDRVVSNAFKRNIIEDTDDCFFLNPQYKIDVREGTQMIISLMQEDQKVNQKDYLKCNFIIIITKGPKSRVWDIRDNHIIKVAIDEKDDGNRREIVTKLSFSEIVKKYNSQNSKKLNKVDHVYVNLIPFIEFNEKYEIESRGKN